jgi:hypothetical protein
MLKWKYKSWEYSDFVFCLQFTSHSVSNISIRQSVSVLTGLHVYSHINQFSKSTNQYVNMETG